MRTHTREARARARINMIIISFTNSSRLARMTLRVISAKQPYISKTVIKEKEGRAVQNTLQIIYIMIIFIIIFIIIIKKGDQMRKTVIMQNRDMEKLLELKDFYTEYFKQDYSDSETFREAIFQEWLTKVEVPKHNKNTV